MHEPVSAKGMRQFRTFFYMGLVGSFFLDIVVLSHTDYTIYYTVLWTDFLQGVIPSGSPYPIGFFVFFSWLFPINYYLPKLVFLAFHVITSYQVYRLLSNREEFGKKELLSCGYVLFNPLLCIHAVYGGLFDTVIGFLVFNFVLLLERKRGNDILKDLMALLLIGVIISIKFVGVVMVIPYLISGWKTMLRRFVLIAGGVALVLLAIMLMHIQIMDLIQPFLIQSGRTMRTIFDNTREVRHIDIYNPPVFAEFVAFYSPIALYATLIALVVSDIFFYIKKVSFRTRVLLNIMIFLVFFNVSHIQFILWYLPLFTLAYNDYMPSKRALSKKMVLHHGLMVLLFLLSPFAQFFGLFFVYDIYKNEMRTTRAAQPLASPAGEGAGVLEQKVSTPLTPVS